VVRLSDLERGARGQAAVGRFLKGLKRCNNVANGIR
jgi:hypothetical protein